MEFTQFHDVYYNTGDGAETQDHSARRGRTGWWGWQERLAPPYRQSPSPKDLRLRRKHLLRRQHAARLLGKHLCL